MNYGFLKTACATINTTVANCDANCEEIIKNLKELENKKTALAVFPELCITAYTCSDLFMQPLLINNAQHTLSTILKNTADMQTVFILGLPVAYKNSLYNCAAVCCRGKLLGIVPKTSIPNYGEFYEYRHFASGKEMVGIVLPEFAGQKAVPFGCDLVFKCKNDALFTFGVEICEDLWVGSSPSENLVSAGGVNIIANLSASNEVIAKAQYRHDLVKMQSGKLCCAYLYADCGFGESTTDLVFSGHNIIAENGTVLSESQKFTNGIVYADIDLERIAAERRRISTAVNNVKDNNFREIVFEADIYTEITDRFFSPAPFVPGNEYQRRERCEEIITMQAVGLATRLSHTGIKNVVLGLSGGLDSTLALIVCVHAFNMLNLPLKNIHTVTMPCFGTTKRTKSNAELLAQAYGVDFYDINITNSVREHFKDIGQDENIHNVTYENGQARERTQVLMDLSNKLSALVIGTGDLSELALGWATYNGDHMSMYAVNVSIPKTLVKYLVEYEASKSDEALKNVLLDIFYTPVSPELLPPSEDGNISQKTEDLVGPYELHDFFLYYFLRFGYSPKKIRFIANLAFKGIYEEETINKWLKIFVKRFFSQQFKRSCLPDGPKVGSVTLSPRGDFRMPSDASVAMWLKDLD